MGFGKTEVAVRAAFKAATDSKQVAVLVPTTVLAYQHYQTFSKRLKDFPVRVDYLTRARSAKQTKELLKDLSEGKVDILIGTHKLIGKQVKRYTANINALYNLSKKVTLNLIGNTEEAYALLKKNYDGYHFSANSKDVYAPFSLLNALNDNSSSHYWFESLFNPTNLISSIEGFIF